jgi:hypothetical protein
MTDLRTQHTKRNPARLHLSLEQKAKNGNYAMLRCAVVSNGVSERLVCRQRGQDHQRVFFREGWPLLPVQLDEVDLVALLADALWADDLGDGEYRRRVVPRDLEVFIPLRGGARLFRGWNIFAEDLFINVYYK